MVRSLALVAVALDWSLPVRQRAHMFLEIFGNIRVRDKTARYLESVRDSIISLVCDKAGRLADAVDPSELTYRDIDDIHEAARRLGYGVDFDVDTFWDHRVRHHYGERFDFRKNLIDWDYQSHVRPACGWIHPVLFRDWRTSGLAFEFGDETYTQPNRTLASYTQGRERGLSKLVWGFWGDIVCSPYWALGTAVERPKESDVGGAASRNAASLFKINNRNAGSEQFRHNAAEVAVLAVVSMLSEIETGTRYRMTTPHDIYSGLGEEAVPAAAAASDGGEGSDEEDVAALDKAGVASVAEAAAATVGSLPMAPERRAERRRIALLARSVRRAKAASAALDNIRLVPMLGDLERALGRARQRARFDGVVVGLRAAQLLQCPSLPSSLKDHAFAVLESARNVVVFKPFQKLEFERRAVLMAGEAGMAYAGSERTLCRSDGFAVGSGTDVRSREQKRSDAEALASKLAEDEGLREEAGPHWPGVRHVRELSRWDDDRGDRPRPEALFFRFNRSDAATLATLMREGPAGRMLRAEMARSQAEVDAEAEAEKLAGAAAGRDKPDAEASQAPKMAKEAIGAGAAWTRGGLGKTSKAVASSTEGSEATAPAASTERLEAVDELD